MEAYEGSHVRVLPSTIEAVRKRPGMYFGDVDSQEGPNHVVLELVANAVDQFLAGYATKVKIEIIEADITVSDDGSGLPFDRTSPTEESANLAEHYLYHLHTTPTADNHAPHIHLALSGVGIAAVNAVSESLYVQSTNSEKTWIQSYAKGVAQGEGQIGRANCGSGTQIRLRLDESIFRSNKPNISVLRKAFFEMAHFYPGLIIEFQKERFHSTKGLLDLAFIHHPRQSCQSVVPNNFYFSGTQSDVQVQVAAIGENEADGQTNFFSWVNGIESISGGTHIEGLLNLFSSVCWYPETVLAHIIMRDPKYANPTKDKLANPEVPKVLEAMLRGPIEQFLAEAN